MDPWRPSAAGLSPKIALPTRTIVAPSSIATSKSWLIPIDNSAIEAAGRPDATSRSRSSRRRRNHESRLLRAVRVGWNDHEAAKVERRGLGGGGRERRHGGFVGAVLGRFVSQIDLNQDARPAACVGGAAVEPLR